MRRGTPALRMFLATVLSASADDRTGQASVIAGDTLEIHGTRIRLWGIDAPESDQLCVDDQNQQCRQGDPCKASTTAGVATAGWCSC
jgi:endonuclease YncB( thermonuclease family)